MNGIAAANHQRLRRKVFPHRTAREQRENVTGTQHNPDLPPGAKAEHPFTVQHGNKFQIVQGEKFVHDFQWRVRRQRKSVADQRAQAGGLVGSGHGSPGRFNPQPGMWRCPGLPVFGFGRCDVFPHPPNFTRTDAPANCRTVTFRQLNPEPECHRFVSVPPLTELGKRGLLELQLGKSGKQV